MSTFKLKLTMVYSSRDSLAKRLEMLAWDIRMGNVDPSISRAGSGDNYVFSEDIKFINTIYPEEK